MEIRKLIDDIDIDNQTLYLLKLINMRKIWSDSSYGCRNQKLFKRINRNYELRCTKRSCRDTKFI